MSDLIRAHHPDRPDEGTVHAHRVPAEDLARARARGVLTTPIDGLPPTLGLPEAADHLLRGSHAAGLAWMLTQRTNDEGVAITELQVTGLEADQPERGASWAWGGQSLSRGSRPRIPLRRARQLLDAAGRQG